MSQRSIVLTLIGLICATPFISVNALTDDEIRAQINTLIGRIQKLQEDMKTLSVPTTTAPVAATSSSPTTTQSVSPRPVVNTKVCARITKALSFGARGEEVLELQKFLVGSNDLSADFATGYFGALTRAAVRAYQAREGIASDGDEQMTGWGLVGARTRARIACGGNGALGANLSVSKSGFIVTVQTTVNTRKSCSAATYALDYGDGSPMERIVVVENACAPQTGSFTHTYTKSGSYTISVTSGTLHVSVPFTITETIACTPPSFSVSLVPSATVGVAYSFPFASFVDDMTGKDVVSVSAENLPQGITLVGQTSSTASSTPPLRLWSLVGTPVSAGTYTPVIIAQNRCGKTKMNITLPISSQTLGVTCSVYQVPICGSGYSMQSNGQGTDGCMLPYSCVPVPVACPAVEYEMPQCLAGQHAEARYNSAGCRIAPMCVADAGTFTASPQSGFAPLTVKFTWDEVLKPERIDFGDGIAQNFLALPSFVTHKYLSPGTYKATLKKIVGVVETYTGDTNVYETVREVMISVSSIDTGGSLVQ